MITVRRVMCLAWMALACRPSSNAHDDAGLSTPSTALTDTPCATSCATGLCQAGCQPLRLTATGVLALAAAPGGVVAWADGDGVHMVDRGKRREVSRSFATRVDKLTIAQDVVAWCGVEGCYAREGTRAPVELKGDNFDFLTSDDVLTTDGKRIAVKLFSLRNEQVGHTEDWYENQPPVSGVYVDVFTLDGKATHALLGGASRGADDALLLLRGAETLLGFEEEIKSFRGDASVEAATFTKLPKGFGAIDGALRPGGIDVVAVACDKGDASNITPSGVCEDADSTFVLLRLGTRGAVEHTIKLASSYHFAGPGILDDGHQLFRVTDDKLEPLATHGAFAKTASDGTNALYANGAVEIRTPP